MTAPLAPGEYLRRRREAAGLTIADVAARIGTTPRLGELDRRQLIASVEASAGDATIHTLAALRAVYRFSVDVVAQLAAIADGEPLPAPRLCTACACSEHDFNQYHGAPGWWEGDLCNRCHAIGVTAVAQHVGQPA